MWHKKTLEELDYQKILASISNFCVSSDGKEEILNSFPFTEVQKINHLKQCSFEWQKIFTSKTSFSFKSFESIRPFVKTLKVEGATLEQNQLYEILNFCNATIDTVSTIEYDSLSLEINALSEEAKKIPVQEIKTVKTEISRIIDDSGQLKNIPSLQKIQDNIYSIKKEIESCLKKFTSDSSLSQVLASNVPAFRAERQVLAVKANMRSRISGIVHEVSSTGATMFIEPDEVVRKNNELIQEEYKFEVEKRKIFTELTQKISIYKDELKAASFTMVFFDKTQSASRWGIKNDCVYAENCFDEKTSDSFPPALVGARHPLLGEKAVPIDMNFLEGKNVLIITGPNTGGKTVSLKTFALFALLNQTGFPLPAKNGTRLPFFNSLFADIGDEQSIDESLSTFSAHMKNIAAAVKHADKNSLVLLDELGSGTDPQEGGAIGMAVLDNLIEKKAFVLVTTHHGILKNYGYTNSSCINASVDFDSTTLSPNYRLLMGVPGESHALDIAKRSGLPEKITKKAKSYITNQQADVSTLIKGLTQKHSEIEKLQKEAKAREALLNEKELKFQQKLIKLREKELSVEERENASSNEFLSQTRKELENLVRYLREGEITREKTLKVKQFISDLTDSIAEKELETENEKLLLENEKTLFNKKLEESSYISENGMLISKGNSNHTSTKKTKKKLSNKEALKLSKNTYSDEEVSALQNKLSKNLVTSSSKQPKENKVFEVGAKVIHNLTRNSGILVEKLKGNFWNVQLGAIQMKLNEKDLTPVSSNNNSPVVTIELAEDVSGKAKPVFELRLLGMRLEEAMNALSKQLDLCQIYNFKNFSIIHGKGNGILQQAVQDFLTHYPAVKSFNFARAEDGGFGKTYVELK